MKRPARRYGCQPEQAEQAAVPAEFGGDAVALALQRARERVQPCFTSMRYGSPAYCQLAETCPPEIASGADDESEMGVFHDLFQPQRTANLRARLAAEPEAQRRGLAPGHFSFNVVGGRCETCAGEGYETVEMQFLADVSFQCPDCHGTRLSEAARSSKIGKINIAEACAMQIDELAEWVRGLKAPAVAPLVQLAERVLHERECAGLIGDIRNQLLSQGVLFAALLAAIALTIAVASRAVATRPARDEFSVGK